MLLASAKHHAMHGAAMKTVIWTKMSTLLQLRNLLCIAPQGELEKSGKGNSSGSDKSETSLSTQFSSLCGRGS